MMLTRLQRLAANPASTSVRRLKLIQGSMPVSAAGFKTDARDLTQVSHSSHSVMNKRRVGGLVTPTHRAFSVSEDKESDLERLSDVEKAPSDIEEEIMVEEDISVPEDPSMSEKEVIAAEKPTRQRDRRRKNKEEEGDR